MTEETILPASFGPFRPDAIEPPDPSRTYETATVRRVFDDTGEERTLRIACRTAQLLSDAAGIQMWRSEFGDAEGVKALRSDLDSALCTLMEGFGVEYKANPPADIPEEEHGEFFLAFARRAVTDRIAAGERAPFLLAVRALFAVYEAEDPITARRCALDALQLATEHVASMSDVPLKGPSLGTASPENERSAFPGAEPRRRGLRGG